MKKRINNKSKFKNRFLRILSIIIIILLVLILLTIILNLILRKEVAISNNQIENLKKIFPKEHIENIKLFKGGLFSIGSTKVICKSIYFEDSGLGSYFFNNPESNESIVLLVHETAHTYQAITLDKCIKMISSSLYNQFIAYLKYGSRNYAYYYNIKSEKDFNPEEEASIIEDYFNLKYMDGDISGISCIDCKNYEKQELIKRLEIRAKDILNKYD
jgi:hypothetical protein